MDLSSIVESLRRGFHELPPVAVALSLLAGPTLALIIYRLIAVARKMQTSSEVAAAPLWVCHGCRSANELRASHCYRCGLQRDEPEEIELILPQRAHRPAHFEAPAGSPFAARAAEDQRGPGRPPVATPAPQGDEGVSPVDVDP